MTALGKDMNVKHFDWTGREWNNALVNEAKSQVEQPMTAICSPCSFNTLMLSGYSVTSYETPTWVESYKDGDLVWYPMLGVPDDALILTNLDTICSFTGFKQAIFERTCDQMPLYQKQTV